MASSITILQLKAGAGKGFQILRAWVTQSSSTTSAQESIALLRKSAAATVTTAVLGTHLFKHDTDGPDPDLSLGTSATGFTASGEGTDDDEIWSQGFNTLIGALYLPVPEERIYIPPGGIIAMKFPAAPASKTWTAGITIKEV